MIVSSCQNRSGFNSRCCQCRQICFRYSVMKCWNYIEYVASPFEWFVFFIGEDELRRGRTCYDSSVNRIWKKGTCPLAPPAWARKWSRKAPSVNIIWKKKRATWFLPPEAEHDSRSFLLWTEFMKKEHTSWLLPLEPENGLGRTRSVNGSYEERIVPPGSSRVSQTMISDGSFREQHLRRYERAFWLLPHEPFECMC